jgi:hypothetical protein
MGKRGSEFDRVCEYGEINPKDFQNVSPEDGVGQWFTEAQITYQHINKHHHKLI